MPSPDPNPAPEVMSASEVRQNFGDVVNRVARGEGRVIIEKHGAPAAGLVSMDDIRRLRNRDEERAARKDVVNEFRAPFADVPDEELELEIAKAIAEVKEDRKRERSARNMPLLRQPLRSAGE